MVTHRSATLVFLWLVMLLPAAAVRAESSAPAEPHGTLVTKGLEEHRSPAEYTLEVWNRPIVTFRAELNTRTPEKRAELAAERIANLSEVSLGKPIEVDPIESEFGHGALISIDDRYLFTLVDGDIDTEAGESFDSVLTQTTRRLHEVLKVRADQRLGRVLLRGLTVSGVATLLFAALIAVLRSVRYWLARQAVKASEARLGQVSRFRLDLRRQASALLRWLATAFTWALGALAAYLWLTFVLVQFPYTEPWGNDLGSFLRQTFGGLVLSAVTAVPKLLVVALIVLITRGMVRLISSYFRSIESGSVRSYRFTPETAKATRRLVASLLWLFGLTIAYPHIPGSNTDAFRGVSVLLGIVVSLGSTGLVNQVMSGLVVIYSRALQPGDYVRVGGEEGLVREIGVLSTKLETSRREEVTIPNALLVGSTTTNFSALPGFEGPVTMTAVTIGYDAPWRQVHALLVLAASRTQGVRSQPEPYVLQRVLSDFYVEYQLIVHIERGLFPAILRSQLHAQIQDAFNEHGVQIMSPHFMAQPDGAVLVPKARWAAAPATGSDATDGGRGPSGA